MGERRTAWHYFLGLLLAEKAPRGFEVRAEVPVTRALQHMDWLLLRRADATARSDHGETLVALWPMLPAATIAEFKSATRGYRDGDLHRLVGYGHQYFSAEESELVDESSLALVLIVAARNAALDRDIVRIGLRERALDAGYARLEGLTFAMLLVDLAVLTTRDREDYVALFAAAPHASTAAWSWWYARYGSLKEARMDQTNLEDIEVMAREFLDSLPLEQRLAGLRPEDRLAGLRPEDRLAGLRPEDRLAGLSDADAVLALPDTVLVGLSDAYVATLPDGVREQVTRRRNARAR
jgi:hypothetical protein